jgi:hypothetical protein
MLDHQGWPKFMLTAGATAFDPSAHRAVTTLSLV